MLASGMNVCQYQGKFMDNIIGEVSKKFIVKGKLLSPLLILNTKLYTLKQSFKNDVYHCKMDWFLCTFCCRDTKNYKWQDLQFMEFQSLSASKLAVLI